MFYHVLSVLPPEFATGVRDMLQAPDQVTPHNKLRDTIIQRATMSEHKRLEQLLNGADLVECTPLQFLVECTMLLESPA